MSTLPLEKLPKFNPVASDPKDLIKFQLLPKAALLSITMGKNFGLRKLGLNFPSLIILKKEIQLQHMNFPGLPSNHT